MRPIYRKCNSSASWQVTQQFYKPKTMSLEEKIELNKSGGPKKTTGAKSHRVSNYCLIGETCGYEKLKGQPDILANMPAPLPFNIKDKHNVIGDKNESFGDNSMMILRNISQ